MQLEGCWRPPPPHPDFREAGFTITNGDTLFDPNLRNVHSTLLKDSNIKAIVDVFYSHSNDYSYVVVEKGNTVVDMVEKKIISKFASTGMHTFKSAQIYNDAFRISEKQKEEFHLSGVIKSLCKSNEVKILAPSINKTVLDLGNPEKYFNYLKKGRANVYE